MQNTIIIAKILIAKAKRKTLIVNIPDTKVT